MAIKLTEVENHVDLLKTLARAHETYWSTERAWKLKKRSRTAEIDWPATFSNSITQKFNQVWKNKDQPINKTWKPQ